MGSEGLNLTRNWALFVRLPNLGLPVVYNRKEGYKNQKEGHVFGNRPKVTMHFLPSL